MLQHHHRAWEILHLAQQRHGWRRAGNNQRSCGVAAAGLSGRSVGVDAAALLHTCKKPPTSGPESSSRRDCSSVKKEPSGLARFSMVIVVRQQMWSAV